MTDHTEMQIPDDVMEAAGKALHDPTADINGNSLRYFIDERYVDMAAHVIARAILAERERISDMLKDPSFVRVNYLRGDIACATLIYEEVAKERERCASAAASRGQYDVVQAIRSRYVDK